MTPTRVVLAEDQPMIRAGFHSLLDSRPDIDVVGEAANGVEALEQVRTHRPDVAVMDIRMPEMDGLEATRRITADRALERTRLVVLTAREQEVLGLVARGLTNAEIAETLQLSPLTAKTHVSRILMKLGARDRVQLVVIAYQSGLVDR